MSDTLNYVGMACKYYVLATRKRFDGLVSDIINFLQARCKPGVTWHPKPSALVQQRPPCPRVHQRCQRCQRLADRARLRSACCYCSSECCTAASSCLLLVTEFYLRLERSGFPCEPVSMSSEGYCISTWDLEQGSEFIMQFLVRGEHDFCVRST